MKSEQNVELADLLFNLVRSIKASMSYDSNTAHLSVGQLQTLIYLRDNPGVSIRTIAGYFNNAMPTASVLLDKLIKEKLVKRETDKNDRRIIRVCLSKKGERLVEKAAFERTKKIGHFLSLLTAQEKKQLFQIIKSLSQRINGKK